MKIFGYKIANLTRTQPDKGSVIQATFKQQLYRVSQDVSKWRNALNYAESIVRPNRSELIRTYNDIVLDNHLSALMQSRKNKVLSKEWGFYDKEGQRIAELDLLIESDWFVRTLDCALDSIFYGYSLVQFGEIYQDNFNEIQLVPREYISPERGLVLERPTSTDGVSYLDKPYSDWCLFAGQNYDLGLLNKAAPLVIYKKFVMGNWSEFAEVFGMPYRKGKTNVRDAELMANMRNALSSLGSNGYGIFDTDDDIEFLESSRSDSFNVYDKFIERINSELSKLIIGQTGTTDMGKNRGSDDVHENVSDEYGKRDGWFLRSFVNGKFVPFLKNLGFKIPEGSNFKEEKSQQIGHVDLSKFVIDLLKLGEIDDNYIEKKFGVPFKKNIQKDIKVEDPTPNGGTGVKKLQNKVNEIYSTVHICDVCNKNKDIIGKESTDLFESSFSEQDLQDMIQAIYYGLITTGSPSKALYAAYGNFLNKGVNKGVEFALEFGQPDPLMLEALADNTWHFSAAKTWQMTKDMQSQLFDEFGNKREFASFKKAVSGIVEEYNANWLKTEYNLAISGSQMASHWASIEKDKKTLPYLMYKTVGDGRVRPEHKAFNNVIKKVDDKFWNQYLPPNGWNCRCIVIQLVDGKETDTSNLEVTQEQVPDYFRFNPGKKKLIYPKSHPYFEVSTKYRDDKTNNFNLPLRP